jgi:tRNA(Ile)-lysidine synthase
VNDGEDGGLLRKLAASWPADSWCDVTVLVATSGGADSVALVRGLHALRKAGPGTLILAHYNHRQRGGASDTDEQFVVDLAAQLRCPVVCGKAASSDLKSEDFLRRARYEFLTQAAGEKGARYVATAHTADDQVETVLFNVLRGTGLSGLAGIPRSRELNEAAAIIRPMLGVRRCEVLAYLRELGQSYREDASNASLDYARNRIRHELLPYLEENYNPQIREAILRLSQVARWSDESARRIAREVLSRVCKRTSRGVEVRLDEWSGDDTFAARELLEEIWKREDWPLADMSFERWKELLAFALETAPPQGLKTAPRMFPGGVRAEREGNILRLFRVAPPESPIVLAPQPRQ